MSMDITRKTLEERFFEPFWQIVINETRNTMRPEAKERILHVSNTECVIETCQWKSQLYGIVSIGMPIWGESSQNIKNKKKEISRFIGEWERFAYASKIKFKSAFKIYHPSNKSNENEQIASFAYWRKNKADEQLAFIFSGIFWFYKDGEDLDSAAKRFIYEHPHIKKAFEEEFENDYQVKNQYISALFDDGAIIFKDDVAAIKHGQYNDLSASMWALIAIEGFFENVKQVFYAKKFTDI